MQNTGCFQNSESKKITVEGNHQVFKKFYENIVITCISQVRENIGTSCESSFVVFTLESLQEMCCFS